MVRRKVQQSFLVEQKLFKFSRNGMYVDLWIVPSISFDRTAVVAVQSEFPPSNRHLHVPNSICKVSRYWEESAQQRENLKWIDSWMEPDLHKVTLIHSPLLMLRIHPLPHFELQIASCERWFLFQQTCERKTKKVKKVHWDCWWRIFEIPRTTSVWTNWLTADIAGKHFCGLLAHVNFWFSDLISPTIIKNATTDNFSWIHHSTISELTFHDS